MENKCEQSILGVVYQSKCACLMYGTDGATPHPTPQRGATFSQDPGEGKELVLPAYLYSEFYITQ